MNADQLKQINEGMRRGTAALVAAGAALADALRAAAPALFRAHGQALASLTPAQQQHLMQEIAEGTARDE